jgi:hypothetical protein
LAALFPFVQSFAIITTAITTTIRTTKTKNQPRNLRNLLATNTTDALLTRFSPFTTVPCRNRFVLRNDRHAI